MRLGDLAEPLLVVSVMLRIVDDCAVDLLRQDHSASFAQSPDQVLMLMHFSLSRRAFLVVSAALIASPIRSSPDTITFIFISDVHACRMDDGLSPNCQQKGKTDANLRRHVRAINDLAVKEWPTTLQNGEPAKLPSAGTLIGASAGIVVGGDMTDDGGGRTAEPREGSQILQFAHRHREGAGEHEVRYPIYAGLGNHDLDQDGKSPDVDWYRNELRDYVRLDHEPSAFFKPAVPVLNFDEATSCYSWNWGELHLVQLHRFGGDTKKGSC